MKAKSFLSKILLNVTPSMHKNRRLSLFASVESAINGGSLSVTGLGRNIEGKSKEKHRIKRAVRLWSNHNLYREIYPIDYLRWCKRNQDNTLRFYTIVFFIFFLLLTKEKPTSNSGFYCFRCLMFL